MVKNTDFHLERGAVLRKFRLDLKNFEENLKFKKQTRIEAIGFNKATKSEEKSKHLQNNNVLRPSKNKTKLRIR